jgi:hypothetical protein
MNMLVGVFMLEHRSENARFSISNRRGILDDARKTVLT